MLRLIFILTLGLVGLQPDGYAYDGHFTIAEESRTFVVRPPRDIAEGYGSYAGGNDAALKARVNAELQAMEARAAAQAAAEAANAGAKAAAAEAARLEARRKLFEGLQIPPPSGPPTVH